MNFEGPPKSEDLKNPVAVGLDNVTSESKAEQIAIEAKLEIGATSEGITDTGSLPQIETNDRIPTQKDSKRQQSLEKMYEDLKLKNLGLIKLEKELVSKLAANRDVSLDDLTPIINNYAHVHNFSQKEVELATSITQEALNKRELIHKAREQYPNDNDLFEAIFGKGPSGKIEIVERPFIFLVRCYNLEDYIGIHRGSEKYSESVRDMVAGTSAVVSEDPKLPGLEKLIVIENMNSKSYTEAHILVHEERHALNSILGDTFFEKLPAKEGVYSELKQYLEGQKSLDHFDANYREVVDNHLMLIRKFSETRLKDELVAYTAEGDENAGYGDLSLRANEGGIYDYCVKDIDYLKSIFPTILAGDLSWEFSEINKIFVSEFSLLRQNAWSAGLILKDFGYSNNEAAAFLAKIPLNEWFKNVKRLVGPENYKKHEEELTKRSEESVL